MGIVDERPWAPTNEWTITLANGREIERVLSRVEVTPSGALIAYREHAGGEAIYGIWAAGEWSQAGPLWES